MTTTTTKKKKLDDCKHKELNHIGTNSMGAWFNCVCCHTTLLKDVSWDPFADEPTIKLGSTRPKKPRTKIQRIQQARARV
jgi:hypothetical protein